MCSQDKCQRKIVILAQWPLHNNNNNNNHIIVIIIIIMDMVWQIEKENH